jgi:hypothetical protein
VRGMPAGPSPSGTQQYAIRASYRSGLSRGYAQPGGQLTALRISAGITPHKRAWHSLSLRCRGSGPDARRLVGANPVWRI